MGDWSGQKIILKRFFTMITRPGRYPFHFRSSLLFCMRTLRSFSFILKNLMIYLRGEILANGKSSYPAFPPETNPEVWYAWDMEDPEDGDIYQDLLFEINKINDAKRKVA